MEAMDKHTGKKGKKSGSFWRVMGILALFLAGAAYFLYRDGKDIRIRDYIGY